MADDWPDMAKAREAERRICSLLYGLDDLDATVVMASVVAQMFCARGLNRDAAMAEFNSLVGICFARCDARAGLLSDQQSACSDRRGDCLCPRSA